MTSQRYERVSQLVDDDTYPPRQQQHHQQIPDSPPPSFRSRASSINSRQIADTREREPLVSDADRNLAATFDAPSDDDSDDEETHRLDDRQRAMSGRPSDNTTEELDEHTSTSTDTRPNVERRVTRFQTFVQQAATGGRVYGGGSGAHDGVFANMSAKPERGDDLDEKPPSYEQAAADATPPYWETTILAPGGSTSDDVFIDGLPVGSFFSFIWNGMISMSFQLVGFLLTYLLHTTHAAKNGSKAGLGITLIQYGINMRRDFGNLPAGGGDGGDGPEDFVPPPSDPNSHNFDPNTAGDPGFIADASDDGSGAGADGIRSSDWFAYALMVVGWFILIRSLSEYIKARRHEQLVLQSPARGLNVPVVAAGEQPEEAA